MKKVLNFGYDEIPYSDNNEYFNFLLDKCKEASIKRNENEMAIKSISKFVDGNALKDRRSNQEVSSSTYLIYDRDTELTKIGFSWNPLKRLFLLQSNFIHATLIYAIEGNYEHELHQRYKNCRKNGEWFDLDLPQIVDIAVNYPKREDTYLSSKVYFTEDVFEGKDVSATLREIVDSNLLRIRNEVKNIEQIHWVI